MAIQYPDCTEANQDTHCKGMNQSCWDGYDESPYAYILFVPMTAALAVGTIYNRNNLKHLKHRIFIAKNVHLLSIQHFFLFQINLLFLINKFMFVFWVSKIF